MPGLRAEDLRFHGCGPLHLAVEAGECVAVWGPSGAGKTLLLRALADLDPHEGRVFLGDAECHALPAPLWRRRVAMLPAESHWWDETVEAHFPRRVDQAELASLGFGPDVWGWAVRRLSTGERQRLALLRLLAHTPEALLLDEPTAHLDVENTARVEARIGAYRREHRAPVLWVTHDPSQAATVAARRLRLEAGTLHEETPPWT